MSTFVVLKQPSDPNAQLVLPGDVVHIHYEALVISTKQVFESTYTRSQPRKVTIGKDNISKGLTKALFAMSKGMQIKLTVPPQGAYGDVGIPGLVPPNAEIQYIVELLEHEIRPENLI